MGYGLVINMISKSGGNTFGGNVSMQYQPIDWNANNVGAGTPATRQVYQYDLAFGGPIKRDRLWFFATARAWQKDAFSSPTDRIWDNKNAGIWGQNYQPDRSQQPLQLMNMTRNVNARITFQATAR